MNQENNKTKEEKIKISRGFAPDMEKIKVGMIIGSYRIEGTVYIHKQGRLSDFINAPSRLFIPVVDVKFYDLTTNQLVETRSFANINRTSISLFYTL